MNRLIIAIIAALLFVAAGSKAKAQCNDQLVNTCALSTGDNATYIKDFPAKLKRARRGKQPPVATYQVALKKGNHYRFTLCNAVDYEGEGVLQLFDNQSQMGSTLDLTTGKEYQSFDFLCKKSAIYRVYISFKKGKEGCAVGILSLVR